MHKSQLSGFIIDCNTEDLDEAATFWAAALGLDVDPEDSPAQTDYVKLQTRPDDLYIEVQKVDHSSRVHLDIEADDIEAEVARLESLGAKRIGKVKNWVVMESPTGQKFCVVRPVRANFEQTARTWT